MDRRTFLAAAAAGALGTLAPRAIGNARAAVGEPFLVADPTLAPFLHGVASGDPLADRVVLWTRVTPDGPAAPSTIEVTWRVARDPALADVVAAGTATAGPDRDWTVKVDPTGLAPATTYYYGFEALGRRSLTGRTRTAPASGVLAPVVRLAAVSCSRTWSGFFNAYGRIADRPDLDLVVHMGDYVYEQPNFEQRIRLADGETPERPSDLGGFRRRYAEYRLDPDLRRAHQQHPWVVMFDNHDGDETAWRDKATGDTPEAVATRAKRSDFLRAYEEWTPSRLTDPATTLVAYRHLPYGDLLDLYVLEERLHRDEPVGEQFLTLPFDEIDRDERTMLGVEQFDWLTERLGASTAAWRVLASQLLFGHFNAGGLPDLVDLPFLRDGGNALNDVGWDGYPAERARILRYLQGRGITDNVVLSGDSHLSFAMDITLDPYDPLQYEPLTGGRSIGVELCPTSVTSGGFDEELVDNDLLIVALETATLVANPHMRFVEYRSHGYGIVDIRPEAVTTEIWYTPIDRPTTDQRLGAAYRTLRGEDHLVASVASATVTGAPALAPEGPPVALAPPPPAPAPTPAVAPPPERASPDATAPPPDRERSGEALARTGLAAPVVVAGALGAAAIAARRIAAASADPSD